MFHFIRTNLPKEIMGFRDYPMPASPRSYILSNEVLSYLISYAEHFKLNELIKFKRHVTRVRPVDVGKWEVSTELIYQISNNCTYCWLSCDDRFYDFSGNDEGFGHERG